MEKKHYDIAVCGGGIAGVAAALAAARRGMKTVLIEKTILPGGLATSGLVLVYLPLCNAKGTQMIYGIAEELLIASNKYGPLTPDPDWQKNGKRYMVNFSPGSMVLVMDELLEEAGVEIWLDSIITNCKVENNRLTEISVFNKSGTVQVSADTFVDATGDADLLYLAGEPCNYSENSMVLWTIEHNENLKGSNDLDSWSHVAIHADPLANPYTYEHISGKMVSDFVLEGRRRYRKLLQKEAVEGISDRKSHYPLTLQTQPPIRKGRCIQGCFTMDTGMESRSFEDSVGAIGDWRSAKVWQVPYRSLLPVNLRGVIAAGRCISAIGDAWEATRVIPVAAMTGEVAGIAATMAVQQGKTPHDVVYPELAAELRKIGFRLEYPA